MHGFDIVYGEKYRRVTFTYTFADRKHSALQTNYLQELESIGMIERNIYSAETCTLLPI